MSLTNMGKIFILFLFALLFAGINTKTNLLHILTSFLIVLMIFSPFLARRNGTSADISVNGSEEIFAGDTGYFQLLITNDSVYDKFALLFYNDLSKEPFFVPHIPSKTSISVSYEISFAYRGVWHWRELQLCTKYPFGLNEYRKTYSVHHDLYILPKPLPFSELPELVQSMSIGDSQITSNKTQIANEDFATLREYKPGDSFKTIHWKASAKMQNFIVKEFEDNIPTNVSMLVVPHQGNYNQEKYSELFEKLITLSASLVWEIARQDRIFLFAQGDKIIKGGQGEEYARQILRILAETNNKDKTENNVIDKATQQIPVNSTVVLVILRLNDHIEKTLAKLNEMGCSTVTICADREDPKGFAYSTQLYRLENNDSSIELEKLC